MQNDTWKWPQLIAVSVAFAVASLVHAPAAAQPAVEYVKVCDAYGTGFYYIPGTGTCLKPVAKYESKPIPSGAEKPAPLAGCSNCAELDREIKKLTDQFNKLEGKGVPKWQEDIASEIANLRAQKSSCEQVCTPPPARTQGETIKVCESYGAGFYYVPGSDVCLKIPTRTYVSEKVPPNVKAPPPPAGCSTCAALDVEIAKLQEERAEWVAKKNATFVLDVERELAKMRERKAACQSVCQRSAEKPKPQRPLETFVPPSRAKGPPGYSTKPQTPHMPSGRPDGALH